MAVLGVSGIGGWGSGLNRLEVQGSGLRFWVLEFGTQSAGLIRCFAHVHEICTQKCLHPCAYARIYIFNDTHVRVCAKTTCRLARN